MFDCLIADYMIETTMPIPGGAADKLGNRYELWWTVSQLVEMIQGRSDAIRIEDPGADKSEFVVQRGSQREMHQTKTGEKWTIARMARDELLGAVGKHLGGYRNICFRVQQRS
jgi:hypothetical protein